MRLMKLGLCFALVSALAFAAQVYLFETSNQVPVVLPLPGPGLVVADKFFLTTGGSFRFEVVVPTVTDVIAVSSPQPVVCEYELEIDGANGEIARYSIKRLSFAGKFVAGNVDYYYGDIDVVLPRWGTYSLRVANRRHDQVFGQTGSMFSLVRAAHETEAYLATLVLQIVAWMSLLSGLMVLLLGGFRGKISPEN